MPAYLSVSAIALGCVAAPFLQPATRRWIILGFAEGLSLGLIPFLIFRRRQRQWAINSLAICGASGLAFGFFFALPSLLVMTAIGYGRDKPRKNDRLAKPQP
jgi:hypothetical protein